MDNLTTIVKEGQRVLTTQQLAEVYNVGEERIRQAFSRNQERFIEGKHYFKLEGKELKEFKTEYLNDTSSKINSLMLWTEKGADRHCKILDTDAAWEQFDNLEETYFRVKENAPVPKLSKEIQAIFVLDERTEKIEHEVKDLKDNLPLFNVDCKELQSLVRKTGIKALGGYKTQAYNDNSLRQKVYQDIQHQIKREFGVNRYEAIKRSQLEKATYLVNYYELPLVLADEVILLNNQVSFKREVV